MLGGGGGGSSETTLSVWGRNLGPQRANEILSVFVLILISERKLFQCIYFLSPAA